MSKSSGLSERELRQLLQVPKLRERALRGLERNKSHLLFDEKIHKRILNFLFTAYLVSPADEKDRHREFFLVYEHLIDGKPLTSAPFYVIDPSYAVSAITKIVNGDSFTLQSEQESKE